MKNLLKFSVKWERLDDRHLVLRLVNADSIESRLKPEEETLEAFAEGIETLGFLLNDKDAELRRGEVVTLEFVGNDLKYFYIRGKKFLTIRSSDPELLLLKPVLPLKGIETLPELFQHRIKFLAEYAGEDFIKWDLQQEIQGCALAVAVYEKFVNGTSLLTEADFAGIGSLLGEDYRFVGGCPVNFALAMAFALQVCPEGLLHRGGKELLPELAKWPVMYLPVCGDTARVHYQPNRNDIVSYVKTQTY
ncbi:MAG: hypothetical protein ACLUH4_06990 [Alphaproteobacteria bacterium]|jgi:hypothetical protein|uniref:hypothetical protein n=1 Tax=Candidatus Scatocola faecigallinarum TaxID=2840916 RepID=UPI00033CAB52|nr:hypothetical protein [Azospirillum sp.]CDB52651.1 unknown [Azospirillum sp. CAG:239]